MFIQMQIVGAHGSLVSLLCDEIRPVYLRSLGRLDDGDFICFTYLCELFLGLLAVRRVRVNGGPQQLDKFSRIHVALISRYE